MHMRQMNRQSPERNRTRHEDNRERPSRRRPEVERLERDSFILLQHAYALTGADPTMPVNAKRLGCELGFAEEETSRLVRYLSWVGYMKESAAGPHLALAEPGIEYVEVGAGRRQTVRADGKALPLPVFLSS